MPSGCYAVRGTSGRRVCLGGVWPRARGMVKGSLNRRLPPADVNLFRRSLVARVVPHERLDDEVESTLEAIHTTAAFGPDRCERTAPDGSFLRRGRAIRDRDGACLRGGRSGATVAASTTVVHRIRPLPLAD